MHNDASTSIKLLPLALPLFSLLPTTGCDDTDSGVATCAEAKQNLDSCGFEDALSCNTDDGIPTDAYAEITNLTCEEARAQLHGADEGKADNAIRVPDNWIGFNGTGTSGKMRLYAFDQSESTLAGLAASAASTGLWVSDNEISQQDPLIDAHYDGAAQGDLETCLDGISFAGVWAHARAFGGGALQNAAYTMQMLSRMGYIVERRAAYATDPILLTFGLQVWVETECDGRRVLIDTQQDHYVPSYAYVD